MAPIEIYKMESMIMGAAEDHMLGFILYCACVCMCVCARVCMCVLALSGTQNTPSWPSSFPPLPECPSARAKEGGEGALLNHMRIIKTSLLQRPNVCLYKQIYIRAKSRS
jgi:hypothetical protein